MQTEYVCILWSQPNLANQRSHRIAFHICRSKGGIKCCALKLLGYWKILKNGFFSKIISLGCRLGGHNRPRCWPGALGFCKAQALIESPLDLKSQASRMAFGTLDSTATETPLATATWLQPATDATVIISSSVIYSYCKATSDMITPWIKCKDHVGRNCRGLWYNQASVVQISKDYKSTTPKSWKALLLSCCPELYCTGAGVTLGQIGNTTVQSPTSAILWLDMAGILVKNYRFYTMQAFQ